MACGVLEYDDRVIDDEARGNGEGHEGEVVEVVAERYMTPKVPMSETATATAGITVERTLREERKNHQYHEAEGYEETDLDVPEGPL